MTYDTYRGGRANSYQGNQSHDERNPQMTYTNGNSSEANSDYEAGNYSSAHKDETLLLKNTRRPKMNGYGSHHDVAIEVEETEKRSKDSFLTSTAIVAAVLALLLCTAVLIIGSVLLGGGNGADQLNGPTREKMKPLFDELDRFIIEDYDAKPTFSDFLPGVAGIYGKPVWAFYVNRGQGIASFGIQSKNYPIMEFNSANKAYQNTQSLGFRTFLQGSRENLPFFTEPFSTGKTCYSEQQGKSSPVKRIMYVGFSEVGIQEIDHANQVQTNVTYFVLPDEGFPALVRRTTITNLGQTMLNLSILDGLAKMEPRGGKINNLLKNEGFSMQATMRVDRPYANSLSYPYYQLMRGPQYFEADPGEQAEGNFVLSVLEADTPSLTPLVYDTSRVFGEDTTLRDPVMLREKSIGQILQEPQYGLAVTSSAFAAVDSYPLQPGESVTISSFYGEAPYMLEVPVIMRTLTLFGYVLYKRTRSREVIKQIMGAVKTVSANRTFDLYAQQNLLDNSLSGGFPIILGDEDDQAKMKNFDEDPRLKVYHLFSRDDGDLERDYNKVEIKPLFFSQGSGKFEKVIQSRRNDVVLHPRTGSFNVQMFLSFIQADAYQPEMVEGIVFTIDDFETCNRIALDAVGPADGHRAQRDGLRGFLNAGPFRPGEIFKFMDENNVQLIISRGDLVDKVAAAAKVYPVAEFKEGYWPDHWIHYLDHIKAYLTIYPDGEENLMFGPQLPYFFSPAFVQPRHQKFVLLPPTYDRGYAVRQVNATVISKEKEEIINLIKTGSSRNLAIAAKWQHNQNATIFTSTPIAKLLLLATIKFATRDPLGMGIEYEGGRAGWNDSMEGLARHLGSGLVETIELGILLEYIESVIAKYQRPVTVPKELSVLINAVNDALHQFEFYETYNATNATLLERYPLVPRGFFDYWNAVATAREAYRESVKVTFSGVTAQISSRVLLPILRSWIHQTELGKERAMTLGAQGVGSESPLPPTFFSYDVTQWSLTGQQSEGGLDLVHVDELEVQRYPLFLQGPVHLMKSTNSSETAKSLYLNLQKSPLKDEALGMFTSSVGLGQLPDNFGKIKMYPPGWFDNQSVWLEKAYRLYTQLLRHELYDEFYSELTSGAMLPFVDPGRYGRSVIESSSFIASSAFENPSVQGRGFLARMSTSTAEFLTIWTLIMVGPNPYFLDTNGQLRMQLLPALPLWLFQNNTTPGIRNQTNELMVSFNLFAQTNVTYINRRNQDLIRIPPSSYVIGMRDGSIHNVQGPSIPTLLADKIRRVVFVSYINVFFDL